MSEAIYRSILDLLSRAEIEFEELEHAPVRSVDDAARARDLPPSHGAKSLLFKVDDWFGVFVMAGDRNLHSLLLRRHFGARRTRFANAEELARLTGVEVGAMPPFGRPIFDLPLYADPSVLERSRIGFTAGLRTRSVLLDSSDWQAVARPEVLPVTR